MHSKSKKRKININVTCDHCEYIARTNKLVKVHQKLHRQIQEDVKYSCDLCDSQVAKKSDLRRHKLAIHVGIRHPCKQCEYQATSKSSFTKHQDSLHNGKKHPCSQCDYEAPRKESLNRH